MKERVRSAWTFASGFPNLSAWPMKVTKLILAIRRYRQSNKRHRVDRRFSVAKKAAAAPDAFGENCGRPIKWTLLRGNAGNRPSIIAVPSGMWLVDVLNEFLNWELESFFATIALLIAKPWRLTNEFIAGQPGALCATRSGFNLLASILFFFAVEL